MAPSADWDDARPFHCDSGFARTTAKDASLSDPLLAQTEQPASGGVEREGQLRGVVEAAAHEVGVINKT
jgi:hypothetical protein